MMVPSQLNRDQPIAACAVGFILRLRRLEETDYLPSIRSQRIFDFKVLADVMKDIEHG